MPFDFFIEYTAATYLFTVINAFNIKILFSKHEKYSRKFYKRTDFFVTIFRPLTSLVEVDDDRKPAPPPPPNIDPAMDLNFKHTKESIMTLR